MASQQVKACLLSAAERLLNAAEPLLSAAERLLSAAERFDGCGRRLKRTSRLLTMTSLRPRRQGVLWYTRAISIALPCPHLSVVASKGGL